jgi:hypothetical protein
MAHLTSNETDKEMMRIHFLNKTNNSSVLSILLLRCRTIREDAKDGESVQSANAWPAKASNLAAT